jgi:hypothetical protein
VGIEADLWSGLHEVLVVDEEVREAELHSGLHDLTSLETNVLEGFLERLEGDVLPLNLLMRLSTEFLPTILLHLGPPSIPTLLSEHDGVHGGYGLVNVVFPDQEDDAIVVLSEVLTQRCEERGVRGEKIFGIKEFFIESNQRRCRGGALRGRSFLLQLVERGQQEIEFVMCSDIRERVMFVFPC